MSTGFTDGAARSVGHNLVTRVLNYALGPACPNCAQHLKTIDRLEEEVARLQKENQELRDMVRELTYRVTRLEQRVQYLEADNARLRRLCRKYGVDPEEDPDAGVPAADRRFVDVSIEL